MRLNRVATSREVILAGLVLALLALTGSTSEVPAETLPPDPARTRSTCGRRTERYGGRSPGTQAEAEAAGRHPQDPHRGCRSAPSREGRHRHPAGSN